jgi:hypothetical protein
MVAIYRSCIAVLALSLVLSLGALVFGDDSSQDRTSIEQYSYSYVVAINGVLAGGVKSIEGGGISAPVAVVPSSTGSTSHPNLSLAGPSQYSDLIVKFAYLTPTLVQWINDHFDGKGITKSLRVACISKNGAGVTVWDRTFDGAVIHELTIIGGEPGSGRGPTAKAPVQGVFIVKFSYSQIIDSVGPFPTSSGSDSDQINTGSYPPKITLNGLTAFVPSSIEPVSIKMDTSLSGFSGQGQANFKTTVSNIVFSVPLFNTGDGIPYPAGVELVSWAKTWLPMTGAPPDSSKEKNGTMEWSTFPKPSNATLLSIKNVGINAYELTSGSDANPFVKISLYCEEAKFITPGTSSPASASQPAAANTNQATEDPTKSGITPSTGNTNRLQEPKKTMALRSSGGSLESPRKLGPFELVVKSVEYVSTGLVVAEQNLTPTANRKLFVVNYALTSKSPDPEKVSSGTLSFQATDASGATYEDFKVGIGTKMTRITGSTMLQDDTLGFSAVTIIPASETIAKLRITNPSDFSKTEYTFSEK